MFRNQVANYNFDYGLWSAFITVALGVWICLYQTEEVMTDVKRSV